MPPEETVTNILENTWQEADKHYRAFLSRFATQSPPDAQQSATTQLNPQTSLLTPYVSQPVQSYLQQNAPGYLNYIRAEHRDDDGWVRWAQKGAWNASIDLVARYAHLAVEPVTTFLCDTASKIPSETFDRLNPANLLVLSSNMPLVQRYFAQRVDQLTTPFQYWSDFRGTFQKQIISTRGALTNAGSHLSALDGGFADRTKQLGEVAIDMTEQSIAGKIGVCMALFALFRAPPMARKTQASFNAMFPQGTLRGLIARPLPVRMMFSKPLARVAGNPLLSFSVVTYMMTMSIANSIRDSIQLQESHPDIHDRLTTYNRDVVNAPFHLNYRQTLAKFRR